MGKAQRGTFIVFEGPDGSGHSTQLLLARDYFAERGHALCVTKEPTKESEAGKIIVRALRKELAIAPWRLQELMVDDRQEHLRAIISPALARGEVVLGDRYLFSTIAFGSLHSAVGYLMDLNRGFPMPDLTFIVLAKAETCMARIKKRGTPQELFEEQGKLAQVIKAYEKVPSLYPRAPIVLVDGESPMHEVFAAIRPHLDRLFS